MLVSDFNAVVAESEQFLRTVAGMGGKRAIALGETVETAVQASPWRALGVAALIGGVTGLLAGIVIARR
jgi:ElaB/YqjD/DUF883 family membrane-anchored ribosome-binding protein